MDCLFLWGRLSWPPWPVHNLLLIKGVLQHRDSVWEQEAGSIRLWHKLSNNVLGVHGLCSQFISRVEEGCGKVLVFPGVGRGVWCGIWTQSGFAVLVQACVIVMTTVIRHIMGWDLSQTLLEEEKKSCLAFNGKWRLSHLLFSTFSSILPWQNLLLRPHCLFASVWIWVLLAKIIFGLYFAAIFTIP